MLAPARAQLIRKISTRAPTQLRTVALWEAPAPMQLHTLVAPKKAMIPISFNLVPTLKWIKMRVLISASQFLPLNHQIMLFLNQTKKPKVN